MNDPQSGRSAISKAALVLISGTVLAQVITLIVTPILTRLYPPDAFGFLSLVLAASSLVAPVIGLRLESALMLPVEDQTSTALFCTSVVSSLVLALGTGVLLETLFYFGLLGTMSQLEGFAWWASSVAFLTSLFMLVSQMALRSQRYGAVSQRTVYQALATAAGQLCMSLVSRSGTGLIAGHLFGRIVGIVPLLVVSRRAFSRFSLRVAWKALRVYWRFPLVFAPSALLNSAGLALPLLFVGGWFTVADAGQWGVADRILAIPLILVGGAVGQVVEAEFASRIRNKRGQLTRVFIQTTLGLTAFSGLVVVAVMTFAPIIMPIYLGTGWSTATELMQILVIALSARLIAAPLSKVLVVLQRAFLNLILDVLRVIAILIALLATVVLDASIHDSALYISLAMTCVYLLTWIVSMRVVLRYKYQK